MKTFMQWFTEEDNKRQLMVLKPTIRGAKGSAPKTGEEDKRFPSKPKAVEEN